MSTLPNPSPDEDKFLHLKEMNKSDWVYGINVRPKSLLRWRIFYILLVLAYAVCFVPWFHWSTWITWNLWETMGIIMTIIGVVVGVTYAACVYSEHVQSRVVNSSWWPYGKKFLFSLYACYFWDILNFYLCLKVMSRYSHMFINVGWLVLWLLSMYFLCVRKAYVFWLHSQCYSQQVRIISNLDQQKVYTIRKNVYAQNLMNLHPRFNLFGVATHEAGRLNANLYTSYKAEYLFQVLQLLPTGHDTDYWQDIEEYLSTTDCLRMYPVWHTSPAHWHAFTMWLTLHFIQDLPYVFYLLLHWCFNIRRMAYYMWIGTFVTGLFLVNLWIDIQSEIVVAYNFLAFAHLVYFFWHITDRARIHQRLFVLVVCLFLNLHISDMRQDRLATQFEHILVNGTITKSLVYKLDGFESMTHVYLHRGMNKDRHFPCIVMEKSNDVRIHTFRYDCFMNYTCRLPVNGVLYYDDNAVGNSIPRSAWDTCVDYGKAWKFPDDDLQGNALGVRLSKYMENCSVLYPDLDTSITSASTSDVCRNESSTDLSWLGLSTPWSLGIVGTHIANSDESPLDEETQLQAVTDSIIPVVWTMRERLYHLGVVQEILKIVEYEYFETMVNLLSTVVITTNNIKSRVIRDLQGKSVPTPAPKTV
jgi:hypothetical protein